MLKKNLWIEEASPFSEETRFLRTYAEIMDIYDIDNDVWFNVWNVEQLDNGAVKRRQETQIKCFAAVITLIN